MITAVTAGPVTRAGSLADPRIELIPGVYIAIEIRQLRWRDIEVADIMLGRILGSARVEQRPERVFEGEGIIATSDDIILMEDVAEEMAIIERVDHLVTQP